MRDAKDYIHSFDAQGNETSVTGPWDHCGNLITTTRRQRRQERRLERIREREEDEEEETGPVGTFF